MKLSQVLDIKGSHEVHTIAPTATLRELVGRLCEHQIGCQLVMEDDNIAGIITERDIIYQCKADADFDKMTVGEVMTKQVVTAAPDYNLRVAIELMATAGIRHLPVLSGKKIDGLITVRDILHALQEADKQEFTGFLKKLADLDFNRK